MAKHHRRSGDCYLIPISALPHGVGRWPNFRPHRGKAALPTGEPTSVLTSKQLLSRSEMRLNSQKSSNAKLTGHPGKGEHMPQRESQWGLLQSLHMKNREKSAATLAPCVSKVISMWVTFNQKYTPLVLAIQSRMALIRPAPLHLHQRSISELAPP